MTKKLAIATAVLSLLLACLIGIKLIRSGDQENTAENTAQNAEIQNPETEGSQKNEAGETQTAEVHDASEFTDTDSLLICANKKHKLPEGYEPSDLAYPEVDVVSYLPAMRYEAAVALENMFAAAQEEGITILLQSGYRSEEYQSELYYGYVDQYGVETADSISSRPGYSDHQTGLACDLGSSENPDADLREDFINTAEGQWLSQHAHEYGFIMRYPEGKEEITGYAYEPWHYRYIGVEEATKVYEAAPNESFEEYYGVEGGDYAD